VAGLPLNCAIRKRRTSFWSAVSNLNMEFSLLYPDAADLMSVHGGRHFQFARTSDRKAAREASICQAPPSEVQATGLRNGWRTSERGYRPISRFIISRM
jgi:hypothetical protein